jgi:hypothetical protein
MVKLARESIAALLFLSVSSHAGDTAFMIPITVVTPTPSTSPTGAVSTAEQLLSKITAARAQTESLITKAAQLENQPTQPSAGNVVNGDLQVNGRVCVGGPCQNGLQLGGIQIISASDADILFVSNSAATPHYARAVGGTDGGFRFYNNARGGGRQPANQGFEPTRRYGMMGFDPMGLWGVTTRLPGVPGENVPDFHWVFEEATKTVRMELRRSGGWSLEYRNYENQYWVAPLQ